MRRITPALTTALTLVLAGCATAPRQQAPSPAPPVVEAPPPQPQESGPVVGMTAGDLLAHFGPPALQVREGNSLKLQFRSAACVLDAYLYPSPSGGAARVTHVDARLPSGVDTNAQACVTQLNRGS
jgi:nitrous oxide reductase accessory protein NosL